MFNSLAVIAVIAGLTSPELIVNVSPGGAELRIVGSGEEAQKSLMASLSRVNFVISIVNKSQKSVEIKRQANIQIDKLVCDKQPVTGGSGPWEETETVPADIIAPRGTLTQKVPAAITELVGIPPSAARCRFVFVVRSSVFGEKRFESNEVTIRVIH